MKKKKDFKINFNFKLTKDLFNCKLQLGMTIMEDKTKKDF